MHLPALPTLSLPASTHRERTLLAAFALLVLFAVACPAFSGPDAVSVFADDRGWHSLPNAMDVLSNLPFLVIGVLGLRWLSWLDRPELAAAPTSASADEPVSVGLSQRLGNSLDCAWLFFAGLIACAAGSVFYHLQPDLLRLAADRAGMAIAFAGLIGVAVCDRVSQRTGWAAAWATLAGGLLAVAVWFETGNVAPWATVQFGGMALVLTLALTKPLPAAAGAVGLKLGWVIFFYALAKLFELSDHAIYEATHHIVSGHSVKHLTAALAGLPVLHALQTVGRQTLRHNPGAAVITA
ncbi:hypothetical protein BH11PSE13_BH11PSE13_08720 [soil metagenome]